MKQPVVGRQPRRRWAKLCKLCFTWWKTTTGTPEWPQPHRPPATSGGIVREELQPVETRITVKIETEIGELREMLVGVVDEDFPPVDQRPRSGGSSGVSKMAAKGR